MRKHCKQVIITCWALSTQLDTQLDAQIPNSDGKCWLGKSLAWSRFITIGPPVETRPVDLGNIVMGQMACRILMQYNQKCFYRGSSMLSTPVFTNSEDRYNRYRLAQGVLASPKLRFRLQNELKGLKLLLHRLWRKFSISSVVCSPFVNCTFSADSNSLPIAPHQSCPTSTAMWGTRSRKVGCG